MTLRCIRCHRPLMRRTASGMGSTCERNSKPIPTVERDLFGFDIPAAAAAAVERLKVHIEGMAAVAVIELRHSFAAARRRAGVWK